MVTEKTLSMCNENCPKNTQKRYIWMRKRLFHHAKVALLSGERASFVTDFSFFLTKKQGVPASILYEYAKQMLTAFPECELKSEFSFNTFVNEC